MPTTDQQVDKKRETVEQLREEIERVKSETSRKQQELDNDNVMRGLEEEEARLRVELAAHERVFSDLHSADETSAAPEVVTPPVPTQAPSTKSADTSSSNGKG